MESELQKKQLLLAADEMPLLRECAFLKVKMVLCILIVY